MVEGGMSCVKYILFVFNFIFVVSIAVFANAFFTSYRVFICNAVHWTLSLTLDTHTYSYKSQIPDWTRPNELPLARNVFVLNIHPQMIFLFMERAHDSYTGNRDKKDEKKERMTTKSEANESSISNPFFCSFFLSINHRDRSRRATLLIHATLHSLSLSHPTPLHSYLHFVTWSVFLEKLEKRAFYWSVECIFTPRLLFSQLSCIWYSQTVHSRFNDVFPWTDFRRTPDLLRFPHHPRCPRIQRIDRNTWHNGYCKFTVFPKMSIFAQAQTHFTLFTLFYNWVFKYGGGNLLEGEQTPSDIFMNRILEFGFNSQGVGGEKFSLSLSLY